MIKENSKAKNLDVSSFDTSDVTDMYHMFLGSEAESLNLFSFDTSNVTSMYSSKIIVIGVVLLLIAFLLLIKGSDTIERICDIVPFANVRKKDSFSELKDIFSNTSVYLEVAVKNKFENKEQAPFVGFGSREVTSIDFQTASNKKQEDPVKVKLGNLIETLKDITYFLQTVSEDEEYCGSFFQIAYLYDTEIRALNSIIKNKYVCDKFLSDIDYIDLFIDTFKTLDSDLNKVRALSTELKFQELTSFLGGIKNKVK